MLIFKILSPDAQKQQDLQLYAVWQAGEGLDNH